MVVLLGLVCKCARCWWTARAVDEHCALAKHHVPQSTHCDVVTYEWVTSPVWMSHASYMYASCHICMRHVIYVCVMSYMYASCHESCLIYVCRKASFWRVNASRCSHVWMSHNLHMNESRPPHKWVTSHICVCQGILLISQHIIWHI